MKGVTTGFYKFNASVFFFFIGPSATIFESIYDFVLKELMSPYASFETDQLFPLDIPDGVPHMLSVSI